MFFENCTTVEEIKKEWRRLCFIYHPDVGGDTVIMQKLNEAYHNALKNCDGVSTGSKKKYTYYYREDIEQAIIDKIHDLIALKLDIDIWLVGVWIWVDGDTKPVKEDLKSLGLRWHSKRRKWYWHSGKKRRRYSKNANFSELAAKYGAKHFKSNSENDSHLTT